MTEGFVRGSPKEGFVCFNRLPSAASTATNGTSATTRIQEEWVAMSMGPHIAGTKGAALAAGSARLLGLLLLSRP